MIPYVETQVKDIKAEDSKISVTGMIVEKGPDYLILDDSTGTLLIRTSSFIESDSGFVNSDGFVNSGGFVKGATLTAKPLLVKVFGNLLRSSENLELNSHLIKDMSEIDKELFKSVKAQYIN